MQRHGGVSDAAGEVLTCALLSRPNLAATATPLSIDLDAFRCGENIYDFDALRTAVHLAVVTCDNLLDVISCPFETSMDYLMQHRPVTIAAHNLQDALALFGIPLDSPEGAHMNVMFFETMYHGAVEASVQLARYRGPYPAWAGSPAFDGELYVDMCPMQTTGEEDFTMLRIQASRDGLRNSTFLCQPSRLYFPTLHDRGSGAQPYTR